MAAIYILFFKYFNRFYVGSCVDVQQRLEDHMNGKYTHSFTAKAKDWYLFLIIDQLHYLQARNIESHIKRMKSKA